MKSTIGVYGLGVMGGNLALNLADHGQAVSVYNRSGYGEDHVTSSFLQRAGPGYKFFGADSVEAFVNSLEQPRKILLMVKAGKPVDDVIQEVLPLLDEGDILIDGGNSHFDDTERRPAFLSSKKIHFVGMGISGGEEGARFGPSLMAGSDLQAWPELRDIFEPVAAKDFNGKPCCVRIGPGGAGHFVKMVHNGIEYADMQLIAEAYQIMQHELGMSVDEISSQFNDWNHGPLNSYLIEITAKILTVKDGDGEPLVTKILDSAGQKGTGKWTAISALGQGIPLPGITQAVYSRFISSFVDLRQQAATQLPGPSGKKKLQKNEVTYLEDALLASRIICYAEGFFMISEANKQKNWGINPAEVARVWQGGCIIRSQLLSTIEKSFSKSPQPKHLLLDADISTLVNRRQDGWRKCISKAALTGLPIPVMMSALSQYDSIRSARLPAAIIQAQRDYFGAHTYERVDSPRGKFFHTDWVSKSGQT